MGYIEKHCLKSQNQTKQQQQKSTTQFLDKENRKLSFGKKYNKNIIIFVYCISCYKKSGVSSTGNLIEMSKIL